MNLFKSQSCFLLVIYLTLISPEWSLGQNWGGAYHKMKERMSKLGQKVSQAIEEPPPPPSRLIYKGPGGQQVPQKYNFRRRHTDYYDQFQNRNNKLNNQNNLRILEKNQNNLGLFEPVGDPTNSQFPENIPSYQYPNYQPDPDNEPKFQNIYQLPPPPPVQVQTIRHREIPINEIDEIEAKIDEKQDKSINTLLEIEEKLENIVNRLEADINLEIGPSASSSSQITQINSISEPLSVKPPLVQVPLTSSSGTVVNDFEPQPNHEHDHVGNHHVVKELTNVNVASTSTGKSDVKLEKNNPNFECDFKGRWLSSVLGTVFELENNPNNSNMVQVKVLDDISPPSPVEKAGGKNEDFLKKSMINKNWFGFGVISVFKNPPAISITLQQKHPDEVDVTSSATFVGQCIQCTSTSKKPESDYQDFEKISVIQGVWILFPKRANCDSKIGYENIIRQKDVLIKNNSNHNHNNSELNFFKNII